MDSSCKTDVESRGMARKTRKNHKDDWIIAIPSYKRAEILRDKTLNTLKEHRIPPAKIHVFVANKEEEALYTATLQQGTYGHLHVAVPGMAAVRNFITGFFPPGKAIFNIDDDIHGFIEYSPTARRNEMPLRSLTAIITRGFQDARRMGFRLFGFYPVANGYFMKGSPPTTDLRYIIGSAWGIINPGPVLKMTLDDKEDYLRSVVMYILDGGVLRYGNIAPKTQYYKTPGGMQEERTLRRVEESARKMVAMFPGLVKINLTKKSGMPEVRLRDSRSGDERTFGPKVLATFLKRA